MHVLRERKIPHILDRRALDSLVEHLPVPRKVLGAALDSLLLGHFGEDVVEGHGLVEIFTREVLFVATADVSIDRSRKLPRLESAHFYTFLAALVGERLYHNFFLAVKHFYGAVICYRSVFYVGSPRRLRIIKVILVYVDEFNSSVFETRERADVDFVTQTEIGRVRRNIQLKVLVVKCLFLWHGCRTLLCHLQIAAERVANGLVPAAHLLLRAEKLHDGLLRIGVFLCRFLALLVRVGHGSQRLELRHQLLHPRLDRLHARDGARKAAHQTVRRFVISDLARHVHLVQRLVERQRLVHERNAQSRDFRDDGKRVRAPRDDVLGRERQGLVELPVKLLFILLRHRSERKAHPLAQIDDRAERSSLVEEVVRHALLGKLDPRLRLLRHGRNRPQPLERLVRLLERLFRRHPRLRAALQGLRRRRVGRCLRVFDRVEEALFIFGADVGGRIFFFVKYGDIVVVACGRN